MNCPNCKNPISDNSQECEWCGCKIITKSKEKLEEEVVDVDEEVEEDEKVDENNKPKKTDITGDLIPRLYFWFVVIGITLTLIIKGCS